MALTRADHDRVPESLRWYFQHPGAWENIKQAITDHDPSCVSLPDIWTGRTGGVSCPSDLGTCDDCGVSFYNEGLMGQYPPNWQTGDPVLTDDDGCEARLCDCCGTARRAAHAAPAA